jgi:hypothetical protein
MDATLKRSLAEQVRRRVTARLASDGFTRTKTSYWTRPTTSVIAFLHLHLYRADASFRAHIGLRAWDDPFEAVELNGPASHPTDPYQMSFSESSASLDACADAITQYVRDVGERWWHEFHGTDALTGPASPFDAAARSALAAALRGQVEEHARAHTRSLLGVV